MSAELFEQFRRNISVQNAGDISISYANITTRLNADFWAVESDLLHSRQVGSYGRKTAIHGISDLDMIFELPWDLYQQYKSYEGNGPSQLLQKVRTSLKTRYHATEIKGDGQVVVVNFKKYRVEVLPAFLDQENNEYIFPDSNNGGSWPRCRPVQEMAAISERNRHTNRNLKRACKMMRAWKNEHGVNMSGMLIDTLVFNFFGQNSNFNQSSYSRYDKMFVSLFSYLGALEHQDYWMAPGSGQRVHSNGKFQHKAKKAAARCQEAVDADMERKKIRLWREVFGRSFPSQIVVAAEQAATKADFSRYSTEEFIEDTYPVDIQYDLEIDSEVAENGVYSGNLRRMSRTFRWLPTGRTLKFTVANCNVPEPCQLLWKVRNVGAEAERRREIRGQIVLDGGRNMKRENTSFHGEHYVEAYVVKDNVCVARDMIDVPINSEQ